MRRSFVRCWTWLNAHLDRRHDLPHAKATTLGHTEDELRAVVNATLAHAWQDHRARVAALEGRRAHLLTRLRAELLPEYDRLATVAGRTDLRTGITPWLHFSILCVLLVAETAFNTNAMVATGESLPFSVGIALGISLALAVLTETVGRKLRQWRHLPLSDVWTAVMVATLVLAATIVSVTIVRRRYLDSPILHHVVHADGVLMLAFAFFNTVVVVAAIGLAYNAHDPVPGFERAKQRRDTAGANVAQLEQQLDRANGAFASEQDIIRHSGYALIHLYRRVNRRGRLMVPSYFDDAGHDDHLPAFARYDTVHLHALADDLRGTAPAVPAVHTTTTRPQWAHDIEVDAHATATTLADRNPMRPFKSSNPTTDAA